MKKIIAVCLMILTVTPAIAQTEQEFEKFTSKLASKAVSIVTSDSSSDVKISEFRELFLENCELKYIGRFVLAQYWKNLTEGEQSAFLDAFTNSVIMNWAVKFNTFQGGNLEINSTEKSENPKSNHYFVNSTMKFSSGARPAQVVWRERAGSDKKIKVVDIVIEGVSMSMTYRNEYRTILQRNGGDINELISLLNKKTDELRASFN